MWLSVIGFGGLAASALAAESGPARVTFTKDVLPILQEKCQECHRAGQMAPMSLMTYDEVRPWAKAIRENVSAGKMPPYFADKASLPMKHDQSLSQVQKDTIPHQKHRRRSYPQASGSGTPARRPFPSPKDPSPSIQRYTTGRDRRRS